MRMKRWNERMEDERPKTEGRGMAKRPETPDRLLAYGVAIRAG
jgi:hypothetical protein